MKNLLKLSTLVVLIFCLFNIGYSQGEGNQWIFGNNAGLNFMNGGAPTSFLSSLNTQEGVATISDESGNLLFYTDGESVWDSNDAEMPESIATPLNGGNSSTQSAIIVPDPGNVDRYYIFTVEELEDGLTPELSYSIVDISLPGNGTTTLPQGDLVASEINNLLNSNVVEKISAVENCDGSGFWVVAHENTTNNFVAYEVTATGVSSAVQSSLGIVHNYANSATELNAVGYMKFSPDGERIALVYRDVDNLTNDGSGAYLYDFDNLTGIVSNESHIPDSDNISSLYGIEFSPDGDQLYIGDLNSVFRANLIAGTSISLVVEDTPLPLTGDNAVRAMQLAPDNNIYVSVRNSTTIARISNPNSTTASIDPLAVALAGNSNCRFGLPTFVQSFFVEPDLTVDVILGPCGEVTLTASTDLEAPLLWNWDLGDGTVINGGEPSITHEYLDLGSSTYTVTLTVTSTGGECPIVRTIETEVTPDFSTCCPASMDPLFVEVTTNITSNTFWTEKIYIPDGVVIQVLNDAILDITNVDVVFGECAGIDIRDGAILRANNSVFRPCNLDGFWRGIRFIEESEFSHNVNECTFKNANIALHFVRTDGIVSNSLFSNCNVGIFANSSIGTFEHPITGNHFVIDDFYPTGIGSCYNFTAAELAYGIRVANSQMLGEVSQNGFVNSRNVLTRMYGIDLNVSSGHFSLNNFTNNHIGINMRNANGDSFLENNVIEFNSEYESINSTAEGGISILSCDGPYIRVSGNEVKNSENNENVFGILVRTSQNIKVNDNSVFACYDGIVLVNVNGVEITNNLLEENLDNGIRMNVLGTLENYITCNDITMKNGEGDGIDVRQSDQNTNIFNNCIKDANRGMFFLSSANTNIPVVRNNFLYNYNTGIQNSGHSGDIGTQQDPGLNTLWSNNNTALDILSNTNIQAADNFGLFNFSFPQVQISSNNPYHSTASCATQIFNMPSQGNLNANYNCNNTTLATDIVISPNGNISKKDLEAIKQVEESFSILKTLIFKINFTEENLDAILDDFKLNDNQICILKYYNSLRNGNVEKASLAINMLKPDSENLHNYKKIQEFFISSIIGEKLMDEEIEWLNEVADSDPILSDDAVGLLRLASNNNIHYRYYEDDNFEPFFEYTVKQIENNHSELSIFPNPSDDNVFVNFITTQGKLNKTISIRDLGGNLVFSKNINSVSTQLNIDISEFQSGVYVLKIVDSNGISAISKFVKI